VCARAHQIFIIPPTDNPVPSFLSKMSEPPLNLFPDASWRTDTLVAVIPFNSCEEGYGYGGPCCPPSGNDFSQCKVSVRELSHTHHAMPHAHCMVNARALRAMSASNTKS